MNDPMLVRAVNVVEPPVGVRGYVRVKYDGKPYWEGPNLVTNAGLAYCAKLLAGVAKVQAIQPPSPADLYETVDSILIGNGGADTSISFPTGLENTPTVPVPPTRPDTALVAQISGTDLEEAGAVQSGNTVIFNQLFQADLLTEQDFPAYDAGSSPPGTSGALALFVSEFGLYVSAPLSTNSALFARVCVPAMAFAPSSGHTIAVEWTVGYF